MSATQPMSLAVGTHLGPYEIISPLGAGGMGEVYRARDTKLGRDVALKILKPDVANDPDRLARFSREAHVLASLNHPNIAHIHGLEDSGVVHALVMELVEGPTLADQIAQGAIPIDIALPIALQIADALEAAHEQGIVHRDLKPANIKVRPDGTVKVLDFGLAKAIDVTGSSSANAMNSPTLSMHATQAGIILGTAAYMSPEQAAGKAVDRRSDLWAFGVVVLEMVTGRPAFTGETVSHVLASVLKTDPDWTALPENTPVPLRRLLRRCLEKDRKRRLDSAADARLEIEEALAAPADVAPAAAVTAPRSRWTRALPWAIAAAALAIAAIVLSRELGGERPTPVYSSLDAPAEYVLGDDSVNVSLPTRTPMVFTPDGHALIIQAARAGKPQLVLRALDRPDARPIAGTDGARVPFVSPDGKWIGFWTANELRKVPLDGGAATTVCALSAALGPFGAAWGRGDVIIFGDDPGRRIMRVAAGGGTPAAVTSPPIGRRHTTPFFLPDGKRLLYSDVSLSDTTDSRVMVQSLDGGDARLVVASAADGRLLPSGQLAFMRLGTLMIAPFDVARATIGDAVVAMSGVMQSGMRGTSGGNNTVAGMFAVSSLGTLAVVRGALVGPAGNVMTWMTRDGQTSPAEPVGGAPTGSRGWIRISPDGSRAAINIMTETHRGLWIADWTRDGWTACPECDTETVGVWSPDGQRVLVGRNERLVAHSLDGSGPDQVMVQESGRVLLPGDWLADGRIVYQSSADSTTHEIKLLDANSHTGRVVLPAGIGSRPAVSPDGRWLAYESAGGNVVAQAFPGPGSRAQISSGGGMNPLWSHDSRTLYYLGRGDGRFNAILAADIAAQTVLTAGKPHEVVRRPYGLACTGVRCIDISADGQRFLHADRGTMPRVSVTRMDLVQNWTATLPNNR